MSRLSLFVSSLCLCSLFLLNDLKAQSPLWPEVTQTNRPWTRWWWQGSNVTKAGITQELEILAEAGIGGVEITPIYGVIGEEEEFIPYLSDDWMEMLEFTLQEADRLGVGVDMATGTGWPFGGPWVTEDNACSYLAFKTWTLSGGEVLDQIIELEQDSFIRHVGNQTLSLYNQSRNIRDFTKHLADPDLEVNTSLKVADVKDPISQNPDLQTLAVDQIRWSKLLPLQCLTARSENGETIVLTDRVSDSGRLDWQAPAGNWTLYAAFSGWHGKMVERAAPGGEGNVIDHFSLQAINDYLARFDVVLEGRNISSLRAFFNDSYEVDDARGQADWTGRMFHLFRELRGYDLEEHLPYLIDTSFGEQHIRVLRDYRQTVSDLILRNFTQPWQEWAKSKGKQVRNQSHGSPGNILDLYAASDIPETEGTQTVRARFASSAGNVSGKTLISAEAATWLGEHFTSDFVDLKKNIDHYFINGVNHIFYHGTCYSPEDAAWPGRLFYAAIHANDRNPLWNEWPTFNQYISRVQSILQQGRSDNDILLYFPIDDWNATPGHELLRNFDGHGPELNETQVKGLADHLLELGHTFDFISDQQIQRLGTSEGNLVSGSVPYKVVLVPSCHYFPLETLEKLVMLAEQGAHVIFQGGLPLDVPGLHNLVSRREKFSTVVENLQQKSSPDGRVSVGEGYIHISTDLPYSLGVAGLQPETLVETGLTFTRKVINNNTTYLITNWSDTAIDQWLPLSRNAEKVLLANPMNGMDGLAEVRKINDRVEVYLQMKPGETFFLFLDHPGTFQPWPYRETTGQPIELGGPWNIHFETGGPQLPDDITIQEVGLWNEISGQLHQDFSGTAVYSTSFEKPESKAEGWVIDLGEVYETAEIELNGQVIANLTGPNYQVAVNHTDLLADNKLVIRVSNLMANRIASIDRNNVWWKKFYNIDFPPRLGENRGKLGVFDASGWESKPSGISGPVQLIPHKIKTSF